MIRTCAACGASNRVPARHLSDAGRCGSCKAALPPVSEPIEVDAAIFAEITREAKAPVLVDSWAAWCGPCRTAAPEVRELAREIAGRGLVLKVDTEAHPALAAQFRNCRWTERKPTASGLDASQRVLLERDLASGSERELLRRSGMRDPSVSPDGRYIALRATAGASTAVLLVPTAGGEPRELIRVNEPQGFSPFLAWAPDGRGVSVAAKLDESGKKFLWLVPVGGDLPRKLDIDTRDLADESRIAVNPDGRQIAYIAGESKREVWALENFLPAAKGAPPVK